MRQVARGRWARRTCCAVASFPASRGSVHVLVSARHKRGEGPRRDRSRVQVGNVRTQRRACGGRAVGQVTPGIRGLGRQGVLTPVTAWKSPTQQHGTLPSHVTRDSHNYRKRGGRHGYVNRVQCTQHKTTHTTLKTHHAKCDTQHTTHNTRDTKQTTQQKTHAHRNMFSTQMLSFNSSHIPEHTSHRTIHSISPQSADNKHQTTCNITAKHKTDITQSEVFFAFQVSHVFFLWFRLMSGS